MPLYLLGFRLEIPGPMRELSRRVPDVDWSVRPLGSHWLAEDAEIAAGASHPVMVERSASERALLRGVEAWDATVLPPLVWRSGVLTARLLSRRPQPPRGWRRRYPGLALVAKREIAPEDAARAAGGIPRWELGLTRRQREVLDRAVKGGYYEVPRRTTVAAIASGLALGRSTVEEHLRAAESIVVRAAAPLAVGGEDADDLWRTFARFSSDLDLYVWISLRGDRIASVSMRPDAPSGRAETRHPYLDRILKHVETGADDLQDLPVELDVSDFEREVLGELRRIPPGTTATYGEIAGRLGRPGAARAVGHAVARNPVPIVVPCHRVVPRSGGIGRYSGGGGVRTKAVLLRREGAPVANPAPPPASSGKERPTRTGSPRASEGPAPSGGPTSRRRPAPG